jgi:hypothetical protein
MIKPQSSKKQVNIAEDSLMRTPDKKGGDISQFNPLETPRTQATTASKSSSMSMKNQKSPGTMMRELTHTLDNTSLNLDQLPDSSMSEPIQNNKKRK